MGLTDPDRVLLVEARLLEVLDLPVRVGYNHVQHLNDSGQLLDRGGVVIAPIRRGCFFVFCFVFAGREYVFLAG